MTRLAQWITGFARFWYRFIIGDDWTLAAVVVVALAVTDLLKNRGVMAWWLVPLAALAAVGASLARSHSARATRSTR